MEYVYLVCAAVGGTLLILQFAAGLIGLDDSDTDADVDAAAGDGWLVGLLSLRALTGAVTFFGMGGIIGQAADLAPAETGLVAFGAGLAAMALVAGMVHWLRGLQSEGTLRIQRAVGKPATVYLPVPGKNHGQGKVTVVVQNRSIEYAAMTSHSEDLPTGASVVVTGLVNPETLEVMPESLQPESAND